MHQNSASVHIGGKKVMQYKLIMKIFIHLSNVQFYFSLTQWEIRPLVVLGVYSMLPIVEFLVDGTNFQHLNTSSALTDATFQRSKNSTANSDLQPLWVTMDTAMTFLPSLVSAYQLNIQHKVVLYCVNFGSQSETFQKCRWRISNLKMYHHIST